MRDLPSRVERGADAATIDDRWFRSSPRYDVFDQEHFVLLMLSGTHMVTESMTRHPASMVIIFKLRYYPFSV